jgi:hypothetical protein
VPITNNKDNILTYLSLTEVKDDDGIRRYVRKSGGGPGMQAGRVDNEKFCLMCRRM